ncbi:uncharacterized protein CBL_20197 [Carabus blaptoides fortunei]
MNNYLKCTVYLLACTILIAPAVAWDSDQLEIFDLVEEINQFLYSNFYTVFNISQDAELPAIKKAFRSLSLLLHPDKNDSPDAEVQSRNIVAVYDVLKDPSKHEHYNEVLKNGLPNWKSAVYYYRHVRKMGLHCTHHWPVLCIVGSSYREEIYSVSKKQKTRGVKLGSAEDEIASGTVSSKSTECWPSTLKGRQTRGRKLPSVYLTRRK